MSFVKPEKEEHDKEAKNETAEFILELIKVILQTGYYSPDHPITNVAMVGLYDKFRKIVEGNEHITFMLSSLLEKEDIYIEGIHSDTVPLTQLMKGLMGEHFVKKFIEYFDRNHIVAFTIKSTIEKVEFQKFLAVIVEWHLWEKEAKSKGAIIDNFTESLIRNGIFNVGVIHRDDVIGQERHIPWTVKLALTRLRKDLRLLPLYRQASKKDIAELKQWVIKDVVRPLKKGDFVKDLLLNIDLVAEGLSEIGEMDLEAEVIKNLKSDILPSTSLSLMKTYDYLSTHEDKEHPGYGVKFGDSGLKRILKKFSLRLYNELDLKSQEILEIMFRKEILKLSELPEKLQKKIKAEILTEQFIKNELTYLKDFEKTANPKTYLKYLKIITIIIVELIRRRKYQIIDRIFTIIEGHLKETEPPFVGRDHYINEAISLMKTEEIFNTLIEEYNYTKKEFREALGKVFFALQTDSIPHLIKILSKTDDIGMRRDLCSLIEKFGENARPYIEDELRSHKHPWFTIRNLIFILGNIGNKESAKFITPYFSHHHSKVREECIDAIFKLIGNEGEAYFLRCLRDSDIAVRRKSIQYLGMSRSLASSFFNFIRENIRLKKKGEKEEDPSVQIACVRAIQEYEAVILPDQAIIEQIIINVLKRRNIIDYLRGRYKYQEKPPSVRSAMAEILGFIGSGKSEDILLKLLRDKDDAIKKSARRGLDTLRDRMSRQILKKGVQYYQR